MEIEGLRAKKRYFEGFFDNKESEPEI